MNLALLDPFRRQLPDRIDCTLHLPRYFHQKPLDIKGNKAAGEEEEQPIADFTSNENKDGERTSKQTSQGDSKRKSSPEEETMNTNSISSCLFSHYNRRGTYIAVGHQSGAVAIFDSTARTLAALYYLATSKKPTGNTSTTTTTPSYVTCASWSRKGTVLWVSSKFHTIVQRLDLTHPQPDYYILNPTTTHSNSSQNKAPGITEYLDLHIVDSTTVEGGTDEPGRDDNHQETTTNRKRQRTQAAQSQVVELPNPIHSKTGCIAHPRDDRASLACLSDGSLVLLYFAPTNIVQMLYIVSPTGPLQPLFMNCAVFDRTGQYIFAITSSGIVLSFQLKSRNSSKVNSFPYSFTLVMECPTTNSSQQQGSNTITSDETLIAKIDSISKIQTFEINFSRHGDLIAVNSFTDGTIKIYDSSNFVSSSDTVNLRPRHVLSDPVQNKKSYFVSCDFSGDCEYVVAGKNLESGKYELFVWDTTTGALLDRLTGPQTLLNHLAWHPNRSFVAASTSDGLVDIWGPRMDWTAFAPDFQALPSNVEYVEQEDEFDIVVMEDANVCTNTSSKPEDDSGEDDEVVDVVSVVRPTVFESDSEDEVFYFPTCVKNTFSNRSNKLGTK